MFDIRGSTSGDWIAPDATRSELKRGVRQMSDPRGFQDFCQRIEQAMSIWSAVGYSLKAYAPTQIRSILPASAVELVMFSCRPDAFHER